MRRGDLHLVFFFRFRLFTFFVFFSFALPFFPQSPLCPWFPLPVFSSPFARYQQLFCSVQFVPHFLFLENHLSFSIIINQH